MKARVLTNQQAELVFDKPYNSQDTRFWVLKDENDNLCITEDCVQACEFSQFAWLKDCPLIDYVPKYIPLPN